MINLLRTLRPQQWIKSAFLLAPALFSLEILNSAHWLKLAFGVGGFSLVASAVYAFNDIINCAEDRRHPVKRHRPVASGAVTPASAGAASVLLIGAGLLLLRQASPAAAYYGAAYAGLMAIYTLLLRRLMIVDVITIAVGFVLRIETGGVIVDEPVSHWLLLCTFTLALFLGMNKRRQEIAALGGAPEANRRAALSDYPNLALIDGWINITAAITMLCYALYTVDPATTAKHGTASLIYTVPIVIYGVFRYQKIAVGDSRGEDPVWVVLNDWGIKTAVGLWVLMVGLLLYYRP